jgi:hypothetical protein
MASDNMRQRVFRRMLAREAGSGAGAPAVAAAARRLCEHFARQLSPLVGDAGVAAIYARSLHLTQRQFPRLAPDRTSDQDDGPFARAQLFVEHQESDVATEAAVAVLTTVGELLASFIGESLTTRLLREAWPDDFAGDATEETKT